MEGYILFRPESETDWETLNPFIEFPWIKSIWDIIYHTLKIELSNSRDIILLRFVHFGDFSCRDYYINYFEIANSFYQTTALMQIDRPENSRPYIEVKGIFGENKDEDLLLKNEKV